MNTETDTITRSTTVDVAITAASLALGSSQSEALAGLTVLDTVPTLPHRRQTGAECCACGEYAGRLDRNELCQGCR